MFCFWGDAFLLKSAPAGLLGLLISGCFLVRLFYGKALSPVLGAFDFWVFCFLGEAFLLKSTLAHLLGLLILGCFVFG